VVSNSTDLGVSLAILQSHALQNILASDAEAVLKRNAQIIQQWTAALRARHSGDNSPQNNARIEQCSSAMQSSIQLLARLADSQGRPINIKHEDVKAGLPPSLYSLRVQPWLDKYGSMPMQQLPQQPRAAVAAPPHAAAPTTRVPGTSSSYNASTSRLCAASNGPSWLCTRAAARVPAAGGAAAPRHAAAAATAPIAAATAAATTLGLVCTMLIAIGAHDQLNGRSPLQRRLGLAAVTSVLVACRVSR